MEMQRESIFVSAIRTFCRLFFGVVSIFLALVLCSIAYSILSPSPLMQDKTTLEILPDAYGNREIVSPSAPAILQIAIRGVIGDPKGINSESIESILLESRQGMLSRDRVKGILLHFNTPGGTVVDSDNIYRMIKDYKERYNVPVFGFVDGLCASGGMYIASAADKMYGGPSSIIGSVGVVIGPFFNVSDAIGRIGIQARTLTQGIDKDMMNPTRPWVEGEDASLKAITSFMYTRFVDVVTEGRPRLNREKLISQYGAQVFDCVQAEDYGYIDVANANRSEALAALLEAAHIDPKSPYQVIELRNKVDFFSELLQGKSPLLTGKIEHTLDIGQPPIRDKVAYLYQP